MAKDATIAEERDVERRFSLGQKLFGDRKKPLGAYPALVYSENHNASPALQSHRLTVEKMIAQCTGNA